jgi:predicted RNA-binding protein associated with RNAse of E/G family
MWREGSGPLGTGAPITDISAPHFAQPVTVVRDDAFGLVVWLPIGTPVLRAARADGRAKRADPATLFTTEVVQDRGVHADFDQLRVAPTGRPWSMWVFFTEGTRELACWYVNLEAPHVRDGRTVHTSDHVLDLVITPDRSVTLKDEDELVLAVAQGLLSPAAASVIEADAAEVAALVADWGSPFCDGWELFRPDPDWPIPGLPEHGSGAADRSRRPGG